MALHANTTGDSSAPTRGFSVDISKRNDVLRFWHEIYVPSDSYWERMDWTGNYHSTAPGAEGSVSAAFVDDVERRVNFVRALCGVPANITMNSESTVLIEPGDAHVPSESTRKREAIQRSALMTALVGGSNALSHDPPSSLPAWTVAAWNANNKSTISKGFYGAAAVDAYFREDVGGVSNWNYDVGHRRWLLAVPLTDMATGDTPGSFDASTLAIVQPTNLIYVKSKPDELSAEPARFVSYPAPGYFPVQLNSPFWSLSMDGADFRAATVSMTDGSGEPVPVEIVSVRTGYAENAIVWSVPDEVRARTAPVDRSYQVTVTNIAGVAEEQHSWSVTLIDPDRLTDSSEINGPETPMATVDTEYFLDPVPGCERMETGFFIRESATWEETAEAGTDGLILDRTDPSYDLLSSQSQSAPGYASDYFSQGGRAFRLSFPRAYDPRLNGIGDEVFELDRQLIAGLSSSVEFQFRRGYMTSNTALACERSFDDGLTWTVVGSPLVGATNGLADQEFRPVSLPLPVSIQPFRLRFRLYRLNPAGSFYDLERYPGYATGAFIDELRLEGCDWLRPGGVVETGPAEGVVVFGPSTRTLPVTTGQEWVLRTRAVIGGHPFAWGPGTTILPIGPLGLTGPSEPPSSGSRYSFIPYPGADYHQFEVASFGPASWSEGAEEDPAVIDGTAENYELISLRNGFQLSGTASFRLAVHDSDVEDYFEIAREIRATADSELTFWVRRGSPANQILDVELSTDAGASWVSVFTLEGKSFGDGSGSNYQVDLGAFDGESIRCRFVLRSTGKVTFNSNSSGFWLDEITFHDGRQIMATTTTEVPNGSEVVMLDEWTAGESLVEGETYRLRVIPVEDGVPGSPGPSIDVTPAAAVLSGYDAWVAYENPTVTGGFEDADGPDGIANGIKYAFGIDPSGSGMAGDELVVTPGALTLERPLDRMREGVVYAAEFSNDLRQWSTAGVAVTHSDGVLRAVADRPGNRGYLRWRILRE